MTKQKLVQLRPEQEDALRRMHNGCILCGGTGSGKSITGLAYYISRVCDGDWQSATMKKPRDLYIITTAMKRDRFEWDSDMGMFGLNREAECCLYPVKIIVDSWNNIRKYTDITNAMFIFDEQRVVGSGVWAKSFQKIAKKNDWILLSATPGDGFGDYVQVFIANGFYRNKTEFMNRHAIYNRYCTSYPKIEGYREQGYLLSLRNRVLVDMECARKTERHIYYKLMPYDFALYRKTMKERWDPFEDKPIENISKLCYILRKISNTHEQRIAETSQLVHNHGRCIIFYNYDYELDMLIKMCRDNGFIFAQWNGHEHAPIPESKDWVYLVQYAAGSEGWNCTSCDTIIFFSPSYSYKQMEQASGRIDRLNTPYRDLYYYHLRSSSKIDLAINRALLAKKQFNEQKFLAKSGQKWPDGQIRFKNCENSVNTQKSKL